MPPSVRTDQTRPARLSRPGVLVRLALSIGAALLLLHGTFVGSDANFPFGPFSMFAGPNDPNGSVETLHLYATDADGATFTVSAESVGLRPAELEGQIGEITQDPQLLGAIADRYAAANPDAAALVELRLVIRSQQLSGGAPSGAQTESVQAVWTAP